MNRDDRQPEEILKELWDILFEGDATVSERLVAVDELMRKHGYEPKEP